MPKLPDLSKLPDDEYKKLSPEMLMRYNKSMPETDYENPYSPADHPYPKMKYGRVEERGRVVLKSVVVNDAREEDKLGKGWKDSPAAHGIETCPGAPAIQDGGYELAIPTGEDAA